MLQSRIAEIARFAVVGLINTGIDLAVFSVGFYVLEFNLILANTIAYSAGTVNSYLMNKHWTFAGRGAPEITPAEFTRFIIFNLFGLALSNVAVYFFAMVVLPIVAKIGAVGVTFVWNYLTIRRFVFRQTNANET
jgi:putative flippase GtrA